MADRELDKLARYMVHIATAHSDFRQIDHKVCVDQRGLRCALTLPDRVELAVRRAWVATRVKAGST